MVKVSRQIFEGYTHRFAVEFSVKDSQGFRVTTLIFYSNSGDPEELCETIEKHKTEKVLGFKILWCSTKSQDDADSAFIDLIK